MVFNPGPRSFDIGQMILGVPLQLLGFLADALGGIWASLVGLVVGD